MTAILSPLNPARAEHIPYVTADEAYALMKVELDRMLSLLESLAPEDWGRPTACTLWTVRDMVAHQAGGYASGTGYREMFRQYLPSLVPARGKLPEDLVNERQVGERAAKTPAELIDELRGAGYRAIHNWAYGFRAARLITIPHPVAGLLSLGHLMSVIHSRDTWMHRLDICRAAGRPFEQSSGQDGRIAALVMRDVARKIRGPLGGQSIAFDLTGPAGGSYLVGGGSPAAVVTMDALDFNIFASGRFTAAQARERAAVTGDVSLVDRVFSRLLVVF